MNTNSTANSSPASALRATSQIDYILLDGSSSMESQWYDVLAAIDAYVAKAKTENLNSRVILATFDTGDIQYVHRDLALADWKPMTEAPIGSFGGSTPLYDAIAACGRALRDLDPPRASILIVTDGDENASRYTDQTQAKTIIAWMQAKGWQVTFIGCDWNNERMADKLGLRPSAAIGVQRKLLSDAARSLAEKRAKYGLYGTPMHWTEAEQQQFGGLLAAPKEA
jgi:hypothetical protein